MGNTLAKPNLQPRSDKYGPVEIDNETLAYAFAIIVWLAIAYFLGLINEDPVMFILILIPVAVFATFIVNKKCIYSYFNSSITGEFLYIIITVFFLWEGVSGSNKRRIYSRLLFASLFLYIVSLFNFKICSEIVYDAAIIIPGTMAINLILIVVYLYFRDTYSPDFKSGNSVEPVRVPLAD